MFAFPDEIFMTRLPIVQVLGAGGCTTREQGCDVVLFRRGAVLGATVSLLMVAWPVSSAAASDKGPSYVEVPNSSYTLAATDVDLGVFPSDPVRFELALRMRDLDQAKALAYAVSDPGNKAYGQFLSPEDIHNRFSPTEKSSRVVLKWLRGAGLSITYNPANRLFVGAQGTVASANKAFHTDLHRIKDKDGNIFTAPLKPLSVPNEVNPIATGFIEGINHAARLAHPKHVLDDPNASEVVAKADGKHDAAHPPAEMPPYVGAPPPPAFVNAPPCSAYWGEKMATGIPAVPADFAPVPYVPCGYVASQLQGAYGTAALAAKGIDGSGVTVAILDAYASPLIEQDSNAYFARHGQARWGATQFNQVLPQGARLGYNDPAQGGNACDEQGWYGEETLDVEAVHAMAPGADVLYVGAASCLDSDFVNSLNDITDKHLADIITNSWGDTGDVSDPVLAEAYDSVFVQAALEGIGVFFSSGDNGDELANSGARTVDFPASNPWVTAVGGTSLGVGKTNNYLFHTGWSTGKSTLKDGAWSPPAPGGYLYGAGGGTSQVYGQPKYQQGVVPDTVSDFFATGLKGRAVPDISAVGDPQTGFLVGQTQTWPDGDVRFGEYRIGGTSLSSPIMAGIQALADQAAGHAHGFANPAIYKLKAGALRDIVNPAKTLSVVRVNYTNSIDDSDGLTTSLRSFNFGQTIFTQAGYDDITGVGTPKGEGYVAALKRYHDHDSD